MFSKIFKTHKSENLQAQAKPLLQKSEISFFEDLSKALPNCRIFPKIALSEIIDLELTDLRQAQTLTENLSKIKIDFVIFNQNFSPLCAIQLVSEQHLNSQSHSGKSAEGDQNLHDLPAILLKAGIKSIRWNRHALPNAGQIQKFLQPFSIEHENSQPLTQSQTEFSNSALAGISTEMPASAIPPATTHPTQSTTRLKPSESIEMIRPGGLSYGMSLKTLEKITPHGHVKTKFPHIWQRISLFCPDPRHLDKYLQTLAIKDRGMERVGFPIEVLEELAEIQSENSRLIKNTVSSPLSKSKDRSQWDSVIMKR